ncbi:hypothetical protein A2U01_0116112, partial [Trifolium medium]|nr:hypothetical protein [Trifolium medium]
SSSSIHVEFRFAIVKSFSCTSTL